MTLDQLPADDQAAARRLVESGRFAETDLSAWLAAVSLDEVARRGGLRAWLAASGRVPSTTSGSAPTVLGSPPTDAAPPISTDATELRTGPPVPADDAPRTVAESWGSPPPTPAGGRRASTLATIPKRIGRFEVEDFLGRGGMGVVYRARDPQMQRSVAVKLLSVADRDDQEKIERFLLEAQTAGSLRHPHIVSVYEVGAHEDAPYVVMEWIDGKSLLDAVVDGGAWPLRERVALFRDVCRAVAHAHAHGIVHRDLKPSNVLVDRGRRPCILDFGLARRMDAGRRLTVEGQLMGTPGYMPPEQIEGQPGQIGPHSDVFALGVIFYEMLTGVAPYGGHSQMEVISRTLRGEFPPVRTIRSDAPVDLETVCAKAIDPAIARRYPDAGALADELDRWLGGEPIQARPLGPVERLVRAGKRRREALLMIGGAFVLLFFVSVGSRVQRRHRLERALEEGRARRAEARASEARDAYRRALDLVPDDAEAKAGIAWADAAIARVLAEAEQARAEAEASREALRKAGLVGNVLSRWTLLLEPVRALEACFHDEGSGADQRRARAAAAWAKIERFRAETPRDPVSRATLLALAGWARRLAGYEEEGLAWIDEARALDPDLPFGALMRGMIAFGRSVAALPLPAVTQHVTGVAFGEPSGETRELAALRAEADRWLAEGEQARVWGEGIGQDFRAAAAAMRLVQEGRYAEADEALTAALGGGLQAFRTDLLFARAKARYLCKRFAGAVEDMDEVKEVRPGQSDAWFHLACFRTGAALDAAARGGDEREAFAAAGKEFARALELRPDWADAWRHRALLLHDLGRAQERRGQDPRETYGAALEAFGKAIGLDPEEGMAFHNRGITRLSLAEAEAGRGADGRALVREAIADFDASLRLDPKYAFSHASRGGAWVMLGDAAEAGGEDPRPLYRKGIEDFAAALALDPKLLDPVHNRGMALCRMGEAEAERGEDPRSSYDEAIAALSEVVKREPAHAPAWNSLGATLAHRAGYERRQGVDARATCRRALEAYDGALRANPDYVLALDGRGVAWVVLAETEAAQGVDPAESLARAAADHEAALARNPGFELGHHHLGMVRRQQGFSAQARRLDPRESFRAAIASFDAALARNPGFGIGRYYKADTLRVLGEAEGALGGDAAASFRAAVAEFGASLARRPGHPSSLHGRAIAQFRLAGALEKAGDDPRPAYEAAVEDFGAVLQADPGGLGSFTYRGLACELRGRVEATRGGDGGAWFIRALADFDAALARDPGDRLAHERRILTLRDSGRRAEAERACDAALERHPGDATWEKYRAEIRALGGAK